MSMVLQNKIDGGARMPQLFGGCPVQVSCGSCSSRAGAAAVGHPIRKNVRHQHLARARCRKHSRGRINREEEEMRCDAATRAPGDARTAPAAQGLSGASLFFHPPSHTHVAVQTSFKGSMAAALSLRPCQPGWCPATRACAL
eukprot:352911-Chlamydomonas_euryale.AAC.1